MGYVKSFCVLFPLVDSLFQTVSDSTEILKESAQKEGNINKYKRESTFTLRTEYCLELSMAEPAR